MRTVNKLFSFPFEPFHFIAQFILHLANMGDTFGDMFLFKKDDPLCVESNQVLNERLLAVVPKACELIVEVFENLEKFKETGKLDNELLRHDFGGNIKEE